MTTITIKRDIRTLDDGVWAYNGAKSQEEVYDFDGLRDAMAHFRREGLHELLVGEKYRPYADVEKEVTLTKSEFEQEEVRVLSAAQKTMERLFPDGEVMFYCSSSWKKGKISGHFIVSDIYYTSKAQIRYVLERGCDMKALYMDTQVYDKNKTMRLPLCSKPEQKRPLRFAEIKSIGDAQFIQYPAEDEESDLAAGLITFTSPDDKEMPVPEGFVEETKEEKNEAIGKYDRAPMTLEQIQKYVAAVHDDRVALPGIMTIRHLADYQKMDLRQVAHQWAKKAEAAGKYDAAKVDELYSNPGRHPFTFNLIYGWARKDYPNIDNDVPNTTFYNDVRKLLLKTDLTIADVTDHMLGCIAKVSNNGNPVFFQRGEDEWTLLEADMPFASAAENYTFAVANPDFDKTKKAFTRNPEYIQAKFKDAFKSLQQQRRFLDHCSYDRANFKPFMGESPYPKRMFNLFKGFRFQPRSNAVINGIATFKPTRKCDMLLRHIREVLAGGGKPLVEAELSAKQKKEYQDHQKQTSEDSDYILDWLAQMFQEPNNKLGKCLVFRSKPRAGKNTVFDFIRRKLLPEYSSEITNMDSLTQKHNTHRMNQIFTVLNEVGNFGGDKRNNNKMKSIITDLQIFIEPKGMKGFYLDDVCRYVMLTNNLWPCDMNDERYAPFQCSNDRCGDVKYFEELHASLTDECAEEFFQILMHRDLTGRNLRVVPKTSMGEELLSYSESTTNKFFLDVADREVSSVLIHDDIRIHRDPLYDEYVAWAKRGNAFVQKREQFLAEVAKLGLTLKNVRVADTQARGILCPLGELRMLLRAIPAFANYTFQD